MAIQKALDLAPDDVFLGWVNVGRTAPEREATVRPAADFGELVRVLDVDGTPLRYQA